MQYHKVEDVYKRQIWNHIGATIFPVACIIFWMAICTILGLSLIHILRRSEEARDHQLPHPEAGARRPVLRAHFWAHEGLGAVSSTHLDVYKRQVLHACRAPARRGLRRAIAGPARAARWG